MSDSDQTPVLTALLRLAELQLAEAWATVRDQNSYALALAGLGVAVVGTVVAGQNALGNDWWVPIPGLVLGVLAALIVTRGVARVTSAHHHRASMRGSARTHPRLRASNCSPISTRPNNECQRRYGRSARDCW